MPIGPIHVWRALCDANPVSTLKSFKVLTGLASQSETEKDGAGVTHTILLKIVGELLAIHWSEDEEEVSSVFWLPSLIVPITSSRNIGSVVVPLPRP